MVGVLPVRQDEHPDVYADHVKLGAEIVPASYDFGLCGHGGGVFNKCPATGISGKETA